MIDTLSVLWGNYWISCPYEENKRRILLVGDSVFRQIRGAMQFLVGDDYFIDFWAVSWSTHDIQFGAELQSFMDKKPNCVSYEIILYMENHHSFDYTVEKNEDEYIKYLLDIYNFFLCHCTTCFFASTTLFNPWGINKKYNVEVQRRNHILEHEDRLNCIRLAEYLENIDAEFEDSVHFEECYNYSVANFLIRSMKLEVINQFKTIPQMICNMQDFDFKEVYIWGNNRKAKALQYFCSHFLHIGVLGLVTSLEYRDKHTILLEDLSADVSIIVPTNNADVWNKLKNEKRKIYILNSNIEFMIDELYEHDII